MHEGHCCQNQLEARKGYNVHRQKNHCKQCSNIKFRGQLISLGTVHAEHPTLHLQPIIDAAHGGVHRVHLRNEKLQIIANFDQVRILFEKHSACLGNTSLQKLR